MISWRHSSDAATVKEWALQGGKLMSIGIVNPDGLAPAEVAILLVSRSTSQQVDYLVDGAPPDLDRFPREYGDKSGWVWESFVTLQFTSKAKYPISLHRLAA